MKTDRVLVTGGSGFLGRHVVREFENAGFENIIATSSVAYDLRRLGNIQKMFDDHQPEIVVHLAAIVGGIGANKSNPGQFFYDNAIMGIQLVEEARRRGVDKLVIVGTVCSYPKFTPVPFREDDLWEGYPEETNAPYGLAKKMLLVQAQAYRQEYGFNAIYLLPANLYGPEDNFDPRSSHVVPALIRKLVTAHNAGAAEVLCWGTGTPTREFLFVRDAARGIRLATELYAKPEPVNLGCGIEISIREVAETLAEIIGFKGDLIWDSSKPDGQPRRALDTSRAASEFGFETSMPLIQGLEETVEWYRRQVADADSRSQSVLPS
jgi:GDP-L-fucose synthase